MIHLKILEQIIDKHYFMNNPGGDGTLYHLSEDCFIGFTIDQIESKLVLFDYNDCDFDKRTGEKYYSYDLPIHVEDLLDILYKHEFMFIDEDQLKERDRIIKEYYIKLENYKEEKNKLHNLIIEDQFLTMLEKTVLCKVLNEMFEISFNKKIIKIDWIKKLNYYYLNDLYYKYFENFGI